MSALSTKSHAFSENAMKPAARSELRNDRVGPTAQPSFHELSWILVTTSPGTLPNECLLAADSICDISVNCGNALITAAEYPSAAVTLVCM